MKNKNKLLSSCLLITRYCKIESPYWRVFLEHYKNLGVPFFHICVQNEEDLNDFNFKFKHLCPDHIVHNLDPSVAPNKALKLFNFKLIKPDLKYTFFVDSDEFFSFTGIESDFYECIDFFTQIRITWAMNILENIDEDKRYGYYGHTGKPICLTKHLKSFYGDHAFNLKGNKRKFLTSLINRNTNLKKVLESFTYSNNNNISIKINAILIHYWARGIKDVILRTIFSRFQSFKQFDQSNFFSIVKSGAIPNRLKMMAYLSNQKNYLFFENKFNSNLYDKEIEDQLLKSAGLSKILIDDICENYFNFKNKLALNKFLPRYPSLSIPTMQSLKYYV